MKSYCTVSFSGIPATSAEMKAMKEASLQTPEDTIGLTVLALVKFSENQKEAMEMLNYLRGPRPLSEYDRQFLADRTRGKEYVARSYFKGANPDNNYVVNVPYQIEILESPYSRNQEKDGYLTMYLVSGGADSPRSITVRKKESTGEWFLWEQQLMPDIRKPKEQDPWR